MFVAPLALPGSSESSKHSLSPHVDRRASQVAASPFPAAVLLAWLVIGVCVYVLVPTARGDERLGATLPFWLVVAPLLNVLWLWRRRWLAPLTRHVRGSGRRVRTASAKRLRPTRRTHMRQRNGAASAWGIR
ncbi:MAG: hypothetical protein ABW187_09730 [Dokdonella sp.]